MVKVDDKSADCLHRDRCGEYGVCSSELEVDIFKSFSPSFCCSLVGEHPFSVYTFAANIWVICVCGKLLMTGFI